MDGLINITEKKVSYTPLDVGYMPSKLDILDRHLAGLIERGRLQAASYLISKDDKIFVEKAMGRLRYNKDTSFSTDSIRWVASITKIFTSICILKLVEEGKIHLQQKVGDILEEFKTPMYEKITIQHLLTHTSGIRPDPGAFTEPYPLKWDWDEKKGWIKELLRGVQAVEPGSEWRYSSAGFILLAEIVSRKSGMRYENYVMENIVTPLEMKNTYFKIPKEHADRVCLSNKWQEKWFLSEEKKPEWAPPNGGGGLSSTLEDLQKLGQMLINKGWLGDARILSRKTVEAMTGNHTTGAKNYCWSNGGKEIEYGLGMNVYSNNTFLSPGSFSHEGAGLSGLYMDPVEKVVLVYICPLGENVDWEPEAVLNLRNIVWSGII